MKEECCRRSTNNSDYWQSRQTCNCSTNASVESSNKGKFANYSTNYVMKNEIKTISERSFVDSERGWTSKRKIFVELNSESKTSVVQQLEKSTNKEKY